MRSHTYYCGSVRITLREILVSVILLAVFIIGGIKIAENITKNNLDKTQIYNTAHKVEEPDIFKHLMDTNGGNSFVYGTLKAVDPVSTPALEGEHLVIVMVYEEEFEKKRKVEDDEGNVHYETYYEWEETGRDKLSATEVTFCGSTFPLSKFTNINENYVKTVNQNAFWDNDKRTKYYAVDAEMTGTIYSNLKDGTISDKTSFHQSSLKETVDNYIPTGASVYVFWFFWILLMCGLIVGFCYIDNRWLG